MVAICKSIYVVYNTNSTHKFLPSGLFKYFCMGENGWRVSIMMITDKGDRYFVLNCRYYYDILKLM